MNGSRVGDGRIARAILIGIGLTLAGLMLVAPIGIILARAFARGFAAYQASLLSPDTLHAIMLTVGVAVIVVPINLGFGLAAAWAITRFPIRMKRLLITLIELPFSISPIVAGVIYLFLYGTQGLWGAWLGARGIQLMFTPVAIVLVSLFITSPLIARELISFMESQGREEEEAALSLGASGFMMFMKVTLPSIRWALLYGVILCTARTIGEFGAVSVVSGNIRGQTNTLPLQIELLYNDYDATGAFAAATVLTLIALGTVVAKLLLRRTEPG